MVVHREDVIVINTSEFAGVEGLDFIAHLLGGFEVFFYLFVRPVVIFFQLVDFLECFLPEAVGGAEFIVAPIVGKSDACNWKACIG